MSVAQPSQTGWLPKFPILDTKVRALVMLVTEGRTTLWNIKTE
jgi:hypothetical protein